MSRSAEEKNPSRRATTCMQQLDQPDVFGPMVTREGQAHQKPMQAPPSAGVGSIGVQPSELLDQMAKAMRAKAENKTR